LTTLSAKRFKDFILKTCMEDGLPLLIEGIENEVDNMLDPILDKNIM